MAADFKVISIVDPAVDWKRLGGAKHVEYRKTRRLEMLNGFYLPDRKPTIFHVREIRHRHMQAVDRGDEADKYPAAFQYAVTHVENLQTEDGVILPSLGLARESGEDALREAVLERFEWSQLLEIGSVAFQRSFFRMRTDVVFQLPRSLVELWVLRVVDNGAAANPTSPAPSNDATFPAASATTAPEPSSSGSPSGSPTAVTAADPSTAAAA